MSRETTLAKRTKGITRSTISSAALLLLFLSVCMLCSGGCHMGPSSPNDIKPAVSPSIDENGRVRLGSGSGGERGDIVSGAYVGIGYDDTGQAWYVSDYKNLWGGPPTPRKVSSRNVSPKDNPVKHMGIQDYIALCKSTDKVVQKPTPAPIPSEIHGL